MRKRGKAGGYLSLILFLALGAFIGDLIGEVLANYVEIFGVYAQLGFSPVNLKLLHLFDLTLGLSLRINMVGALGGMLAVFLWWR